MTGGGARGAVGSRGDGGEAPVALGSREDGGRGPRGRGEQGGGEERCHFTTQSKCDTNIEIRLLTTVKAMILHLLTKVKVLRCLMVFYLDMLKISLYLQQL